MADCYHDPEEALQRLAQKQSAKVSRTQSSPTPSASERHSESSGHNKKTSPFKNKIPNDFSKIGEEAEKSVAKDSGPDRSSENNSAAPQSTVSSTSDVASARQRSPSSNSNFTVTAQNSVSKQIAGTIYSKAAPVYRHQMPPKSPQRDKTVGAIKNSEKENAGFKSNSLDYGYKFTPRENDKKSDYRNNTAASNNNKSLSFDQTVSKQISIPVKKT